MRGDSDHGARMLGCPRARHPPRFADRKEGSVLAFLRVIGVSAFDGGLRRARAARRR